MKKTKPIKPRGPDFSGTTLIVKLDRLSASGQLLADIMLRAELDACLMISGSGKLLAPHAIFGWKPMRAKYGAKPMA